MASPRPDHGQLSREQRYHFTPHLPHLMPPIAPHSTLAVPQGCILFPKWCNQEYTPSCPALRWRSTRVYRIIPYFHTIYYTALSLYNFLCSVQRCVICRDIRDILIHRWWILSRVGISFHQPRNMSRPVRKGKHAVIIIPSLLLLALLWTNQIGNEENYHYHRVRTSAPLTSAYPPKSWVVRVHM